MTSSGAELIFQVGKDFTVTGTDTFGGHGPGDHDGDGGAMTPPIGQPS